MNDFKYIMVTNWELHWDKLKAKWNNSTLFTIPIIKDGLADGPWPDEVVTLFIKRNKSNAFEKSWIGKAKNFRRDPNGGKPAIRFEVTNLKEIDYRPGFEKYSNGWHLNKNDVILESQSVPAPALNLQPAFFKEMENCDWGTFELYSFYLLRLLGINDINKIPQADNRGKADGFFKLSSLAVIYDATLDTNFVKTKEQQIENYISQLKKDKYKINNSNYTIKEHQKQVWIITRGDIVKEITSEDNIKVKEVPFKSLIDIYYRRLTEDVNTETLTDLLKNI